MQARAAAVHYAAIKTAAAIRVRQERSPGSSIDIADVQSKDLVMGADKDSADKAKADVERVEAEEDEARAKSGQRPPKPSQAENPPRGASLDRPKPAP